MFNFVLWLAGKKILAVVKLLILSDRNALRGINVFI